MEDGDWERKRKRHGKRRRLKRLWLSLLMVFLLLVGAGAYLFFRNSPSVEEKWNCFYSEWLGENEQAFEAFNGLAAQHGWKMYARSGRNSIGIFDLGSFTYEPLYSPPGGRKIRLISRATNGRVAFIESGPGRTQHRPSPTDFKLGILERSGKVTRAFLDDETLQGCRDESTIVLAGKEVLFASNLKVYLYDIEGEKLKIIQQWRVPHRVHKVLLFRGEYPIVHVGTNPAYLLVFDTSEPHPQLSTVDRVDDIILVGDNMVCEKNGTCYLYDPLTGKKKRLTLGKLSVPWGNQAFLFYTTDWRKSETGEAWCDHELFHRFNLSDRSTDSLWVVPRFSTGFGLYRDQWKPYQLEDFLLSPDQRFLLVPWEVSWGDGKSPFSVPEYEAYELSTGEKRGVFLAPRADGGFLEFLGWVEDDQTK